MADFTKTITNSIQCFGAGPSSQWGVMQWNSGGTYKWGEGTVEIQQDFAKVLSPKTLTLSDTLSLVVDFNVTLSESLPSDFEASDETLSDQAGYSYVFRLPTTNAEDQIITSYTTDPDESTSYASLTVATTVWS